MYSSETRFYPGYSNIECKVTAILCNNQHWSMVNGLVPVQSLTTQCVFYITSQAYPTTYIHKLLDEVLFGQSVLARGVRYNDIKSLKDYNTLISS